MKKTIKTKFRFFSLLLIILALFSASVFTSCENNVTSDKPAVSENTSGKGKIQIRFNPEQLVKSEDSRTVLPEVTYDTITKITLRGTHNEVTSNLYTWNSFYDVGSVMIEVGTWDLELIVINNGQTFTSETETVEVEFNTTKDVSFTLSTSSTEGGINLNIDFSGEAVAATYILYNFPSDTEESSGDLTVVSGSIKTVTYNRDAATNPIAKGTYRLEVKFWADGDPKILLNTYSEIIRVKAGFTSSGTRYIDLNNLYNITYEADGGAILTGSYVNNYSLHSGTIALPTLKRSGYKFEGWFKDSALTNGPVTEFDVRTETSLSDKTFYAKWSKVCAITYYIANQTATAKSDCIQLTDDQCEEWGLVQSHTQGQETELPLNPIKNENNVEITLAGYTLGTLSGTALSSNGSKYIIPATVSTNTEIYVRVKSHIAYIDPSITSEENNLPFNPSTPAKSVETALKWLKNADSDKSPVLYVKSSIKSADEVLALNGLSRNVTNNSGQYGGAVVKRYSTLKSSPVINLTEGTVDKIEYVTIDGGANWGTIPSNSSVSACTNNGLQVTSPLVTVGSAATLKMEHVTLMNNDNNNTSGTTLNILGTVEMTFCYIKNCKANNGAAVNISKKLTAAGCQFTKNYSTVNAGAIYCDTDSNVSISGSDFTFNESDSDGGAIYNNARTNPLIIDNCYFSNNINASGVGGTNIYDSGYMKLTGNMIIEDGDIYFDVPESNPQPIILDADFESNNIISIVPYKYNNTKLFVLSGLSAQQKTDAVSTFALDSTDYEIKIIGDEAFIKPKAGSITITPGIPDNYICNWSQSVSGSIRTINIIVKDNGDNTLEEGTADGTINSVTVDIYDVSDKVKSVNSLSFTYPVNLDPPSGHPFYVRFNVKVNETTQYSYDYWPDEL